MKQSLQSAPGAKAAKNCGILSIIMGFTCIGLPIGIVLAIVALMQQSKAKAAAKAAPDRFERPAQTGLVTGIVGLVVSVAMLPVIGIVSAIAIPALLGQRSRPRDKVSISNMESKQVDLIAEYQKLSEGRTPALEIPARLEAYLGDSARRERNPWAPTKGSPAFDFHIRVAANLDQSAVENMAIGEATTLGRPVFVIELPTKDRSGYLASAVRLHTPLNQRPVYSRVLPLE